MTGTDNEASSFLQSSPDASLLVTAHETDEEQPASSTQAKLLWLKSGTTEWQLQAIHTMAKELVSRIF